MNMLYSRPTAKWSAQGSAVFAGTAWDRRMIVYAVHFLSSSELHRDRH